MIRAAGGEAGPVHSAGLLMVREGAWPVADLRVDWHETDPIGALAERTGVPREPSQLPRFLEIFDPTRPTREFFLRVRAETGG